MGGVVGGVGVVVGVPVDGMMVEIGGDDDDLWR